MTHARRSSTYVTVSGFSQTAAREGRGIASAIRETDANEVSILAIPTGDIKAALDLIVEPRVAVTTTDIKTRKGSHCVSHTVVLNWTRLLER